MKCPKCGSTQVVKQDQWVRRCEKCGHVWAV